MITCPFAAVFMPDEALNSNTTENACQMLVFNMIFPSVCWVALFWLFGVFLSFVCVWFCFVNTKV